MRFLSVLRAALPYFVLVMALGLTSVLSAQSFTADVLIPFSSGASFPDIPPFPFTSDYVQCVAPAIRQQENNLAQLQRVYEQQRVILVEARGQARIAAWSIPERSARSRANRDIDRAYRDHLRILDRWFRDQEKAIKRQFKDAEDLCDDQFDDDVDSPDDFSSSRSSFSSFNFSSSSFIACFGNDLCLPQQTCIVNGGIVTNPGRCGDRSQMNAGYVCCNLFLRFSSSSRVFHPVCGNRICEEGEGIICPPCDAFPCTNSCAIGTCPQNCFSSSSSSERIFYPQQQTPDVQPIPSCPCRTVCDPSGSPCMAVCPSEC